jgi:hypothetical protein
VLVPSVVVLVSLVAVPLQPVVSLVVVPLQQVVPLVVVPLQQVVPLVVVPVVSLVAVPLLFQPQAVVSSAVFLLRNLHHLYHSKRGVRYHSVTFSDGITRTKV